MRESVKNKRKIAFIAIAIILTMLMGIVIGLLPNNPMGNTGIGTVDDSFNLYSGTDNFAVGGTVGLVNKRRTRASLNSSNNEFPIDKSNATNTLRDAMNNDSTAGKTYVLMEDIEIGWNDQYNVGNPGIFRGTLDGNGYSIKLTDSGNDNEPSNITMKYVQKTSTGYDFVSFADKKKQIEVYGGLFTAVNNGTIKNVTFTYANSYYAKASETGITFGYGVVCGINDTNGVIDNVKVVLEPNAKIIAKQYWGGSGDGNRVVLGGICANQSGQLSNVHVEMKDGSRLAVDSNYYKAQWGWSWGGSNRPDKLDTTMYTSITGGVYGAYTPSGKDRTFNLSFRGSESASFGAKHSITETNGSSSTGGTEQTRRALAATGCIAGFSIEGVKGVYADFKGRMDIDWTHAGGGDNGYQFYNASLGDKNASDPSTMEAYLAFTGTPVDYYHVGSDASKTAVCANNAPQFRNYSKNFFANSERLRLPTTESSDFPKIHHADRGGSADAVTVRSTSKRNEFEYAGYVLNLLGSVNIGLDYATNRDNAGKLTADKRMTESSGSLDNIKYNYTANDVLWNVEAKGRIIETGYTTDYKKIAGYDVDKFTYGREFKVTWAINEQVGLKFTSGKRFTGITIDPTLAYTGANQKGIYVNKVLTNIQAEILANQGSALTDYSEKAQIVNTDTGVTLKDDDLTYPKGAMNIEIQHASNNDYTYFNSTNRICIEKVTVEGFQITPADATDIEFTTGWSKGGGKAIKINLPTLNDGAITGIKYCKDGEDIDSATMVAINNFTAAGGATFTITEETLAKELEDFGGTKYKFILYKGDNPVAFVQNEDGTKSAFELKNKEGAYVKIDATKPTFKTETDKWISDVFTGDSVKDLWYGAAITKTYEFSDIKDEKGSGLVRYELWRDKGVTGKEKQIAVGNKTDGGNFLSSCEYKFGEDTGDQGEHTYKFIIFDAAGNSDSREFKARFDVKDYNNINAFHSISYSSGGKPYNSGSKTLQTVEVEIDATNIFGIINGTKNIATVGGIYFAPTPDQTGNYDKMDGNTTGYAKNLVADEKNGRFKAEIKSTYYQDDWAEPDGVHYSFTVTTVAVNPDSKEAYTITIQGYQIWIARQPISLTNNDIVFVAGNDKAPSIYVDSKGNINFVKTYDRTSDLVKGVTGNALKEFITLNLTDKDSINEVLGSYYPDTDASNAVTADNLFDNLDVISAKFFKQAQGTNAMINANEDEDDYYLIVEIRAKDNVEFALKTNYYIFTTKTEGLGDTLSNSVNVENSENKVSIGRIGINKAELTNVSIETTIIDYGDFKIGDSYSKFDFKLIIGGGLLEGDSADDLMVEYHIKQFDKFLAEQFPNAGTYKVSAIQKGWTNYKLAKVNDEIPGISGDLVIKKYQITKVTFANNDFSNISSTDVPNVQAYFWDEVHNTNQYLKVIYKNSDFEQVEFKVGKKMPVGTYYYVVIIESADDDEIIKLNYTCTHMPSELIKRFEVVGEKVVFNENFRFSNWDSKEQVIRLTFDNIAFDIYSMIEYLDFGLHGKINITYGYDENPDSNILEVGDTYFIRVYVAADDKYAAYEGRFSVVVEKATIDATANDIILPSADELVYNNTAIYLSEDSVSEQLQGKLEAKITDDEKKNKGTSYKDNFTIDFAYAHKIGDMAYNFTYDKTKIIDCGTYAVKLTISGDNINDIVLIREYEITKRDVAVEFDKANLEAQGLDVRETSGGLIATKTFDTKAVNVEVTQAFKDELARLTAGHDNWNHGFGQSNGRTVAGTHKTTYDFNNSLVLKNPCINLVSNVVEVVINKANVELDLTGLDPNTEYKGTEKITIKPNDLKKLEALGVDLNNIEIDYSRYLHMNAIEPIKKVDEYEIGFNVSKANSVPYLIKVELKNERNVSISNNTIEINIRKAKVDSDLIGLVANHVVNGRYEDTKITGTEFEIEYSGYGVKFGISNEGKENLEALKVYESDWAYILRQVGSNENISEAINAGKYEFRFTVTNENYLSDDLVINITINKKKLDEYTGVFDSNTWYIKQAGKEQYDLSGDYESYGLPNDSDLEYGLIYRREYEGEKAIQDLNAADKERFINANRLGRDYTQRFYSMRLRDHDMLIAEGFEITYYYDGIEAIGVSQAGSHTVTAKITKNDSNWEDKIVELYELDSNGNFVYKEDYFEIKDDADGRPVITRSKSKKTLNIAKAELQEEIDYLASELQLASVEGTFSNKFYSSKYTKEQIRIFENKMYRPLISGSNAISGIVYETTKYKDAGEYSIIITIFMKDSSNLSKNDLNYESAEMETTITINPMEVTVHYEFDEKNLDSKGNLKYKEGADIEIKAYYFDYFGDKVYIENLTIETVSGEGDETEFGTPGRDKETGEILYTPSRYQVTPVIADTNYFYNEEAINEETNAPVNALRFTITNVTSNVNTSLYVIAIVAVAMLVIAGFVVLYMVRMFNPAVQDINLGNDDGIDVSKDEGNDKD